MFPSIFIGEWAIMKMNKKIMICVCLVAVILILALVVVVLNKNTGEPAETNGGEVTSDDVSNGAQDTFTQQEEQTPTIENGTDTTDHTDGEDQSQGESTEPMTDGETLESAAEPSDETNEEPSRDDDAPIEMPEI